MSYSDNKGKYQKSYDFLYKKLVPTSGKAKNALGEALRLVSRVYYRKDNDGDSYDDCIEDGIVPDFAKKHYPFNGEYAALGNELDHLLSSGRYDEAVSLVLFNIMLSLSSTTHIYNPASNRLVEIDSEAGKKALADLDINTVFINYCGKNEDWLPEQLRKDGVKITKLLSEETRKELKCDTIEELHKFSKSSYSSKKKTMKIRLSHDNSILSKKFKKIESQHKKSVKEDEKKRKESAKKYEQTRKRDLKHKVKHLSELKKHYESLKELTVNTRVATLKKLTNPNFSVDSLIKMTLLTLIDYKEKTPTTTTQKEHRSQVISKLVSVLNKVGSEITKVLDNYSAGDRIWSDTTNLTPKEREQINNTLVEVLGSPEAVDELWRKCCN
jgi:hypothetical protein